MILKSRHKTLIGSITLESTALALLKTDIPYLAIFLFLIFHFTASLLFSTFIYPFISSTYRNSKGTFLAIFLSVFLFPVIGYIVYLILYIFVLKKQKTEESLPISRIQVEEITMDKVKVKPRKFGESILNFLKQEIHRIDEKTILLLKEIKSPISIEIAKKALGNPKDEVRLTAFSIISKLEKEINDRISFLKNQLKKKHTKKELLEIYKNLTLSYWELLYFGLVDKELENFVVKEALSYAEKTLELGEDAEIHLVAGRIFLRKGNYEKAYKYLSRIFDRGDLVTKWRAVPYLAEVEFYRGNYRKVKRLWKEIPISLHPNVYFMKLLWEGRLKNGR